MHNNWSNLLDPTTTVLAHQTTEEVDTESRNETDVPSLILRHRIKYSECKGIRETGRRAKQLINYKGMFALFSAQAQVSKEATSRIFESDCSFLSTLDIEGS